MRRLARSRCRRAATGCRRCRRMPRRRTCSCWWRCRAAASVPSSFGYGALKGMRETMVPAAGGPVSLLSPAQRHLRRVRRQLSRSVLRPLPRRRVRQVRTGLPVRRHQRLHLRDLPAAVELDLDRRPERRHQRLHGPASTTGRCSMAPPTRIWNRKGRPLVAVGATDVSYGAPFLFTQENFDLICANLESFPLARSVAASNGFPGLFSPVTLTSRTADCGGRKPGWLTLRHAGRAPRSTLPPWAAMRVTADRYTQSGADQLPASGGRRRLRQSRFARRRQRPC